MRHHSLHTGIRRADVDACDALRILSRERCGRAHSSWITENGRNLCHTATR